MPGPAVFKSVPGFNNLPRFVGVIEQNKISNSYENYCIKDNAGCTMSIHLCIYVHKPISKTGCLRNWLIKEGLILVDCKWSNHARN